MAKDAEGSGHGQIDVQSINYGRHEENLKSMTAGPLNKDKSPERSNQQRGMPSWEGDVGSSKQCYNKVGNVRRE